MRNGTEKIKDDQKSKKVAQQAEDQRQLENSRNISRTLSARNVHTYFFFFINSMYLSTYLVIWFLPIPPFRDERTMAQRISKGTNGL